jgi:putative phosphoesterase
MPLVGLISDTHGLLRPEALIALAGSDLVLHAGDLGDPEILERLRELAPVHAVRGNVDRGPILGALPKHLTLTVGGLALLLQHGHLAVPNEELKAAQVVVQGHSHRPEVRRHGERLHINPGSAGPRRFRLPVTVALLRIEGKSAEAELIDLMRAPGET